jgi:heme/copper-type cytochrome/quinol oxidase subunit 1
MVLSLGGLLFAIDKGLAIASPNLEFSVFILSLVLFRFFGHEEVYIWVPA